MSLDDLPAELLLAIVEIIADPRDLFSVFAASPSLFRVYARSRNRILSTVIKNAIQPQALPHALAIFNTPRLEIYGPIPDHAKFLERYLHGDPFEFPSETGAISDLARICCRVSFLIQDYTTKAWAALHAKTEETPAASLKLTETEICRLQRAFFRYEVYCRAFPVNRSGLHYGITGASAQNNLFISHFQVWEVEELACIHHYYLSVARKVVFELQEFYASKMLASPQIFKKGSSTVATADEPSSNRPELKEDSWIDFDDYDFEYALDWVFHRELGAMFPEFLQPLACLGSACAYDLLTTKEFRERILLPYRYIFPAHLNFLPEVMESWVGSRRHPSNIGAEPRGGFALFGKAIPESRLRSFSRVPFGAILSAPLREMAYVFWDPLRLEAPVIHSSLQHAHDMGLEEIDQLFDYSGKNTCLKKLDGVSVSSRYHRDVTVDEMELEEEKENRYDARYQVLR